MNASDRLWAVAMLGLALGSCQASGPADPPDALIEVAAGPTRERDPRLDELGLVYDDTIITTSARTVDFNGQAVVPRYIHAEKSGMGANLSVDVVSTKVVFGINSDFTVSLIVPYVSKRLTPAGGAPSLRAAGLGDLPLVGKYRFFQKTGPGETTEAAVLVGLELPTGRDDVTGAGVLLPAPLQPGSGSLDAILGGAFTRIKGRWLLNADLIAKFNSEANDYKFGNSLRFDVGGHFRAYPARYERFDQMTVNVVAELNGIWSGRSELNGASIDNSGGTRLFATPGLQVIVSENLLFEGAVQLPVLMDQNGAQLEDDFVAVVGLRARF